MYLKGLNILNFKAILSAELKFSQRVNCFVGNNGAGKTNILEAIHYLSLCKSFVGTTDRQSVNYNQEFFMLDGHYQANNGSENRYSCSYTKKGGKIIKKNDKSYSKISEHIGAIPVVTISPRDNMLIDESGEARRRYLDTFISQFNSEYLKALIKYNSIIAERNLALRDYHKADISELLEIYNHQAAPYADTIYIVRKEIISELSEVVSKYYNDISSGAESIELGYSSQLHELTAIELFEQSLERDIRLGYTNSGVSRDDLKLNINGHPIKRFGSQGQQKSLLIALKLAQYDILTAKRGFKPLLLLDDLFDRLDNSRVERLIHIVQESSFGQIFITDCDKERMEHVFSSVVGDNYSIFDIKNGEIL